MMQANLDLHAGAETVDDRHDAIDTEPPEVRVADAREIGRGNASDAMRSAPSIS